MNNVNEINPSNIVCIYHAHCADGFGAAWAVREALGDDVEFVEGHYQTAPEDLKNKHLILVDFSFPPEVMVDLIRDNFSILIIDHHKSAKENCENFDWNSVDNLVFRNIPGSTQFKYSDYKGHLNQYLVSDKERSICTYFDMDRSGAMMAWNFFHPNQEPPKLLEHIQDRDLWKFELEGTRPIQAAIFSYEYEFKIWDDLMKMPTQDLLEEGVCIDRKNLKDINAFIKKSSYKMSIFGHEVPVLNAPPMWSSDAGSIMAKGEKFAACYYENSKRRVFSLRSDKNGGIDVSEIARAFGGGGHKNAAGFAVPIGTSVSDPI